MPRDLLIKEEIFAHLRQNVHIRDQPLGPAQLVMLMVTPTLVLGVRHAL